MSAPGRLTVAGSAIIVVGTAFLIAWNFWTAQAEQLPDPSPAAPPLHDDPVPPAPVALAKIARLDVVARLDQPLALTFAPGDARKRLFIAEKTGRLRVLEGGKVVADPFSDLSSRVSRGAEQGLLGVAFHPKFAESPRLYLDFTDRRGDTRIIELAVAADGNRADPATERELLAISQPYANHNGGNLVFGPDGMLYVGTGDGGAANDPHGNGQRADTLLGKMMRLDVDERPRPAVHLIQRGLRNPWRYAFDRKTGDLYIADVGQYRWEEIHVLPADQVSKRNLGWSRMEGTHCFRANDCDRRGLAIPAVEYSHRLGCSITGGFVYRGKALPELDGQYFYADYCTALLRSFKMKDGAVAEQWDWKAALDPESRLSQISSFGEDADGEIYVLSLAGAVWKLGRR